MTVEVLGPILFLGGLFVMGYMYFTIRRFDKKFFDKEEE